MATCKVARTSARQVCEGVCRRRIRGARVGNYSPCHLTTAERGEPCGQPMRQTTAVSLATIVCQHRKPWNVAAAGDQPKPKVAALTPLWLSQRFCKISRQSNPSVHALPIAYPLVAESLPRSNMRARSGRNSRLAPSLFWQRLESGRRWPKLAELNGRKTDRTLPASNASRCHPVHAGGCECRRLAVIRNGA